MSINDYRLYGGRTKAQGSIDVSDSPPPDEEVVEEVVESSSAVAPTVTMANTKDEILQHALNVGVPEEDLAGKTKAQVLELLDSV